MALPRGPVFVLRVILLAALVAGCGGERVTHSTDLTLLAVNPSIGRASFHLACGPPAATLASRVRRTCRPARPRNQTKAVHLFRRDFFLVGHLCYLGEEAVRQGILGPDYLGTYLPEPPTA
jgi:hypothetical protein